MSKIYIAICVNADGETIEITNTNYDALMDGIDRHGFDVEDVVEMEFMDWLAKNDGI